MSRSERVPAASRMRLWITTRGEFRPPSLRDMVVHVMVLTTKALSPDGRSLPFLFETSTVGNEPRRRPTRYFACRGPGGSITHFLTEDIPDKVVTDRMNVSQDILDKHYDKRDESVKVEQRRGFLENL